MSFLESNARYLTDYNQWLIDLAENIESNHIEAVKIGEDVVLNCKMNREKNFILQVFMIRFLRQISFRWSKFRQYRLFIARHGIFSDY